MALPDHRMDFLAETEEDEHTEESATSAGLTAEQLADILAENRRSNEDLLRGILAPKAGVPLQNDEIEIPGISLEGLPYPDAHDPATVTAFNKGLTERMAARDRALMEQLSQRTARQVTAQTGQQTAMQRAEAMIRDANPNLPDKLIEMAAMEVAG